VLSSDWRLIVTGLSEEAIAAALASLSGWERVGDVICRQFKFADFKAAMAFANRVAALAEEANHHPDILIEYDTVTLTLSSHDAGGLTERDFRLAARIGV
jgi:4a-hydroxytetrahydrobiopterin dehydratase